MVGKRFFCAILAGTVLAGCASADGGLAASALPAREQPQLGLHIRGAIAADGLQFRDANGNGTLEPYEDWRLPPVERARDLAARMDLREKVGTLMHSTMPGRDGEMGRGAGYDLAALGDLVRGKHVTSFITRLSIAPAELARQSNEAQQVAAAGRLGIPLTISTDPRNHFSYVLGAAEAGTGTTKWPELIGFAALRDLQLVRDFGEIARREYRALGIHMALSPQLDLFTEPRWPRGSGGFGSNAWLTSQMGAAYVASFQGGARELQPDGVMTVVKHWAGYGAQPGGLEAHNYYGRFAEPSDHLEQHMEAFRGAINVGTAGIMPAYPILRNTKWRGKKLEQVGPGFNRLLLKNILRGRYRYDGMILSDWAITRDCNMRCMAPTAEAPQRPQDIATSWGVEDLTVAQRYVKGLLAGIDQFGGTDDVDPLIEAVENGEVSEARLDRSVIRVMTAKFQLGLFDNPYVDPDAAAAQIGRPEDVARADKAQREAQVLLRNQDNALPFAAGGKVWLHGMDPQAARAAGLIVVEDPAQADFAIVRTETAHEELHPHHFFGSRYHEGRLDFRPGDAAYDALEKASAHVPTMLAIFLDRAAVLGNVQDKADVILANFGASDAAIIDVALGRAIARGRLPFELPRSMAAVEAQDPAAPDDSADPLYPYGAGIVPEDSAE
ncbi:beta-glucosidase [Altererythrobacter atlanticus]|nr:glycoside hydrolase family 3 N-terminal domain-containing protein [Croceibacterium atlanticum]MBB5731218.1 beta-glucosidase [Croceibacterium atlanticum]